MAAVELESSTLRADGNLVQYHRLESETATVGNNLTNTGSVAFAAAIFNNGAIFDGTTKKLDATVGAGVDGNFSVVVPLILTTEIVSGFYGFWEATSSTNKLKYILFYNYNGGTPQVIFKRKKEGVSETDATYNISLGTASSHQIGASYDGTNMRLYVDGVLRATVAASGNGSGAVTDTYSLGWSPNYGGLYAKANIDDVALFTRVLTDTEFTNRYDGSDASSGASITLTDVTDNRIFQRNGSNVKPLTVAGTYTGTVTSVEARIVEDGTSTEVVTWTTIDASPAGGTFSGSINVPQGGWYNVQVRVGNDTGVVSNGTNAFAVGILMLCAGQSNMTYMFDVSKGTAVTPDDLSKAYNAGWVTVPADGARTLANKVITETGVPVALVDTSVVSSSITTWRNGQTNFDNAITEAVAAGGEFEYVLFMQGEADGDASMTEATYESNLTSMISEFRADLTAPTGELKVMVCIVGARPSGTVTQIRQAQYDVATTVADTYLGSFNIITEMADSAHYTTAGYVEYAGHLGQAIAFVEGAETYGRGPSCASYTQVSSTVVDVTLTHRGGADFTPTTGITGFRVLDGGTPATISSAVRTNATTIRLTVSAPLAGVVTVGYQDTASPTITGAVFDNSAMTLPLEFNNSIPEATSVLNISNPTGTSADGEDTTIRIKSATTTSITWGNKYRGSLPSNTPSANSTSYYFFKYNSADDKYDMIDSATSFT